MRPTFSETEEERRQQAKDLRAYLEQVREEDRKAGRQPSLPTPNPPGWL